MSYRWRIIYPDDKCLFLMELPFHILGYTEDELPERFEYNGCIFEKYHGVPEDLEFD